MSGSFFSYLSSLPLFRPFEYHLPKNFLDEEIDRDLKNLPLPEFVAESHPSDPPNPPPALTPVAEQPLEFPLEPPRPIPLPNPPPAPTPLARIRRVDYLPRPSPAPALAWPDPHPSPALTPSFEPPLEMPLKPQPFLPNPSPAPTPFPRAKGIDYVPGPRLEPPFVRPDPAPIQLPVVKPPLDVPREPETFFIPDPIKDPIDNISKVAKQALKKAPFVATTAGSKTSALLGFIPLVVWFLTTSKLLHEINITININLKERGTYYIGLKNKGKEDRIKIEAIPGRKLPEHGGKPLTQRLTSLFESYSPFKKFAKGFGPLPNMIIALIWKRREYMTNVNINIVDPGNPYLYKNPDIRVIQATERETFRIIHKDEKPLPENSSSYEKEKKKIKSLSHLEYDVDSSAPVQRFSLASLGPDHQHAYIEIRKKLF